jgi:hypothetical protein
MGPKVMVLAHPLNIFATTPRTPEGKWTQTGGKPRGDCAFVRSCDENILQTIQLTLEMIRLADQGDADREDTGCGILYGILRDSAYKILKVAEEEKRRHQAKGWWPEKSVVSEHSKYFYLTEDTQPSPRKKEEKF